MKCALLRAVFAVMATATCLASTTANAQNPATTINVDATANRKPINANIYGLAFATTAQLNDLNVPINRSGGNPTSRYNWQINADNRGFDWFFQSLAYSSSVAGEGGDTFITQSKAGGAQAMLTVPTIGWVAKLGANRGRLSSFSIAKYGAQQANDWQWFPDAGNGVKSNGTNVTGNDPNDASVLTDSTFQQGWVQHLVTRWGTAANGGLRYYLLDNEPSIWHSTHRDVRPTGVSLDEMKAKTIDYATKIKAIDPAALVAGPEEWGWSGYFYSGLDQQTGAQNGWSFFPDKSSHGNMDYLPWLLDQMRQNNVATGKRLLDIFTVHYYPQGGEFGDDTSTAMQQRRNRSTRSLWDPAYTDETWINDKVKLIPRIKGWVATYYPGTMTGITEYNWGAEGHINGATAQADIFGIFGREGLDIAARWTTPATGTPTYNAIKMYRNYDGAKSSFGDTSVSTTVANPDNLAAFAAQRTASGALTVMVINKALTGNTPTTIQLANFTASGAAQRWQLTSSNTIAHLADVAIAAGAVNATLPPQSITLFVIPAIVATPVTSPNDFNDDGKSDLLWKNAADGSLQGWLMEGLNATQIAGLLPAGGYSVTHVADLDGDGKADLLIRHTDGTVIAWLMNGLSVPGNAVILPAGSGWSVMKTGDLNGDGKADLILQHTDGTVVAWIMNGLSVSSVGTFVSAGSGWSVAKVADLNGDGKSDLIWQHTDGRVQAWLMDGTIATQVATFVGAGSGWSVARTGDFDGDGKTDLLWQHTDGRTQAWIMNGLTVTGLATLTPAGTGWTPVHAGDIDGDGKDDLFWEHTSGASQTWLMNGTSVTALATFVPAGTGWTASHLFDLNGDGKKDVLWKHTNGAVQAWLMNGLTITQLATLAGAGTYQVTPPAP